jgi:hypothetical protein
MSGSELKAGVPGKSVTPLLSITLACWIWPLFHSFVIEIGQISGYALNMGGGLLSFLACALSIVVAIILSFTLYFAMRGKHSPLNPQSAIFCFLSVTIAASTLVTGLLVWMDMFCRVGSCPTIN